MCLFYFTKICKSVSQGQNMISVSSLGSVVNVAWSNNVYACWMMLFIGRSVEYVAWMSLLGCSWDGGWVTAEVSVHRIVSMECCGHDHCVLPPKSLFFCWVMLTVKLECISRYQQWEVNWIGFWDIWLSSNERCRRLFLGYLDVLTKCLGQIHMLEYERQLKGSHPVKLPMQSACPPKVNFLHKWFVPCWARICWSDFGTIHSLLLLCPCFCPYYLLSFLSKLCCGIVLFL
jgi:hypothetical protein